jgi:hypothetical protein
LLKKLILIILTPVILLASFYGYKVLVTASGFKSKLFCSDVFVAEREPDQVLDQDTHSDGFWYLKFFTSKVERDPSLIRTTILGIAETVSVHREKLGCTLLKDITLEDFLSNSPDMSKYLKVGSSNQNNFSNSQNTDQKPVKYNQEKLKNAIDFAFKDDNPEKLKRTRAVIVRYKDQIIAEQYADDFNENTKFNGWSMTKSIMNTLIGILIQQGKVELEESELFEHWQNSNKSHITLKNLLQMNSGLAFDENYVSPLGDAVQMLFNSYSTAEYALDKPLAYWPGKVWYYSSGTSNIISEIIKFITGESDGYISLVYDDLFAELGMNSALIEQDSSGTYIGSSFMHATARDWSKIGQLYLQEGNWNGKQIFPDNWVDLSTKPVDGSKGEYGLHIWLKLPSSYAKEDANFENIPEDAYYFVGYQGQIITIIPSKDLVVVRLGLTRGKHIWDHEQFLQMVLGSIS